MPLAVLVAETLSKKHARKCYRQNHSGPEQKSSLHYVSACSRQVSSGSPPRQNNLRRKTAQNISEKIFLGRYWGSWVSGELAVVANQNGVGSDSGQARSGLDRGKPSHHGAIPASSGLQHIRKQNSTERLNPRSPILAQPSPWLGHPGERSS